MGDHSLASARANPRHCILERCPAMRHETRLPFAEIAPEDVARLACYAALDKVAGEVRAPDQIRIAGMARCTLEASVDACARKLRRNALGPDVPPTAYGSQARLQCHGSSVDMQPDDVHRLGPPRDRNLHPGNKANAVDCSRLSRFCDAAGLVVVG